MLCASRGSFPFIEKLFADSGYAGEKVATATVIAVEIVRKSPDQVGFAVQPRRWVVERFFAWIEHQIRDRLSFMRFLGLGLEGRVPDAKTVWLYREQLTQAGVIRLYRNRRLAKDFEATIASARAFLYAASVMLLVRRLAQAA